MARREALRELQTRLAERLQLAHDPSHAAAWLAVECAGQGLLLVLAEAGEIFSIGAIRPVPRTQPWFVGVTNLRGALHGVVDLAAFLGLRAALAPDAARERSRLVALNPNLGVQCAVLVDRLLGLRAADQLQPEPGTDSAEVAESAAARPAFAGRVLRDAEARRWQEIDLGALARHEQFLGIAR